MMDGLSVLGVALLGPFLDPVSRTYWGGLVLTCLVAGLYFLVKRPPSWNVATFWRLALHRSTGLDVQLFVGRQLLRLLIGVPALTSGWLVATRGVRGLIASLVCQRRRKLPSFGLRLRIHCVCSSHGISVDSPFTG